MCLLGVSLKLIVLRELLFVAARKTVANILRICLRSSIVSVVVTSSLFYAITDGNLLTAQHG